jgi:hypothetical protein
LAGMTSVNHWVLSDIVFLLISIVFLI